MWLYSTKKVYRYGENCFTCILLVYKNMLGKKTANTMLEELYENQ